MKTIIISLILFFAVMFFSGIFVAKSFADEFSPLDSSMTSKNFEAKVGFDNDDGRYLTYHYEF